MPLERKTDLRVIKTRNAIRETFKKMVMEMDATQITVKELTERAMIHRKTFYLHYTTIEALYEDILQELSHHYYEKIDQLPPDAPFIEVNRIFFTYMAEQEPYMEKIVCTHSYREFADKLFMAMLVHNRSRHNPYAQYSQAQQNIINTFLSMTSIHIYRRWVDDHKSLPLEELIALSGDLFTNGVSSILKHPKSQAYTENALR